MIGRAIWFAAGAGAGAYSVIKARKAAEALTADGLRDRLGALSLGARLVREEVAAGRAERETQLREQLGLVPHGKHVLAAGTARTHTDHKEISS
jgi:hypothetical protein